LSVTEVETLLRDPYAMFARKILRLVPNDPLQPQADARIFGSLVHDILEEASRRLVAGGDEEATFAIVADEALAKLGVSTRQQVFIASRLAACAKSFAIFEKRERAEHTRIATEVTGRLDLQIAEGVPFRLTAKADRIAVRRDGGVVITDFKTGALPEMRDVFSGFAPQLTLEAAMHAQGAFAPTAPLGPLADLRYVKFANDGDAPDIASCAEKRKDFDAEALGKTHLSGLVKFLAALRAGEHGFVARRVERLMREGDPYGHLARAAEWSRGSDES
jgi:ATP-dependent helicase/nuclease subunit B